MKLKRFLALLCISALMVSALGGCAVFGDETPTEATETEILQTVQ